MATQVIRYVDPDAPGPTHDGTSWNNAYLNLSACSSAEDKNIITANQYYTIYCRASSGTADVVACAFSSNWVTDSTHHIEVIGADFPSDGTWDDTKYRFSYTDGTGISIGTANIRFYNMQFEITTGATYTCYLVTVEPGGAYVRFKNCLMKANTPTNKPSIAFESNNGLVADFINCVIYGFDYPAQKTSYGLLLDNCTINMYNCLLANCGQAICAGGAATVNVYNGIFYDNSIDKIGDGTVTFYNCCTYDGEGIDSVRPIGAGEIVGADVIIRGNVNTGYYTRHSLDSITGAGIVTDAALCCYNAAAGTKIGTFFQVLGTTYECRDSQVAVNSNGVEKCKWHYKKLTVQAQAGDLVGFYLPSGTVYVTPSGGSPGHQRTAGDETDPTDQAIYTAYAANPISFQAFLDIDWTKELTDPDNGDFHLVAGGNCIGNGLVDPGIGLYSDDITETSRTTPWSIGPYQAYAPSETEYVPLTPYSPIPSYNVPPYTPQVFPFPPLVDIKETLETFTKVIRANDGSEQRICIRKVPRQSFDFDIFLNNRVEMALLDSLLFATQKRHWKLPIWSDKTLHTDTITGGEDTITLDTSYADYRNGALAVIWQSPTVFEVVEVETIYPTYLQLADVISGTFTGIKYIMPCRLAQMISPVVGQQQSRFEGTRTFSFMVMDNVLLTGHTAGTTYLTEEVVTTPSLIGDMEEGNSDADVSIQDYGMGRFDYFSESDYNILSRSYRRRNITRAECWAFRLWLHSFYGQQNIKWFPTFRDDLTLISPIDSADDSFEIEHIRLAELVGVNALRNHLAFVLSDGTQIYKQISSITEPSSGNELVTMSATLGQDVAADDIVCFLEKCRLASDKIEIVWKNERENECDLTIMGVTA